LNRLLPVALAAAVIACQKTPRPVAPFTISVPYEIESLDPHARDLTSQLAVTSHVYEPLVTRDRDMAIRPCLALRWFSPNPLTWVFELRGGVRFHDGRPLTSADVVATFERLRQHPELEIALYANEVESARALDPLRVELRTRRPVAALLNKLSLVFIVPSDAGPGLARQACGTGRYRVAQSSLPGELRLAANDAHWAGPPPLRDVRLRLARAAADALQDLVSGASQFAQLGTRAAERALEKRPELVVRRSTGVFLKFLGYDVARERTPYVRDRPNPFRDSRVRQALALAVDRARLVEQLPIPAVPATQLVPAAIFGFDPALRPQPPDAARARALLTDAGLGSGFEVTLHARQLAGGESAEAVRQMLAAIGIRATVVQLLEPEFRHIVQEPPSLFLTRYACDTGDASDVLNAVIHTIDPSRGFGYGNFGRFSDPVLDAQIEQSSAIERAEVRRVELQRILAAVGAAHAVLPLYYDQNVFALERDRVWEPRADGYVLAWEIGG
jgi:peptide/nickel transport system substrate-binding protein